MTEAREADVRWLSNKLFAIQGQQSRPKEGDGHLGAEPGLAELGWPPGAVATGDSIASGPPVRTDFFSLLSLYVLFHRVLVVQAVELHWKNMGRYLTPSSMVILV